MIEVGQKAPEFSIKNAQGEVVSLKDFTGKKVVLYFYPKDDTPGCTKEACNFRDFHSEFETLNTIVIGVSPDNQSSHVKFATKYNLPFILLADTEHSVAETYGAWGEKSMYGKKYFGIIRSTFVIDENGMIVKVYPKVKPEKHGEEILQFLKG